MNEIDQARGYGLAGIIQRIRFLYLCPLSSFHIVSRLAISMPNIESVAVTLSSSRFLSNLPLISVAIAAGNEAMLFSCIVSLSITKFDLIYSGRCA